MDTRCEIAHKWMPHNPTNEKSTLVQATAWCRQATRPYLGQCWSRSMLLYRGTRCHCVLIWDVICMFTMTSSNGNIFRFTDHLCGEFTGHRWISYTKGQWRGALMFSLIYTWINSLVNSREAGDLRRQRAHYDVTVMCAVVNVVCHMTAIQ